MAYSKSKTEYNIQYAKENIKRIPLDVQKQKYEEIKAAADAAGEKVNGYIKKAIDQRMERENVLPMLDQQPTHNGPSQQTTTIPGEIQDTHHKYLTEEDEKEIDLQRILSDVHYKREIIGKYGWNVFDRLESKAKQQAENYSIH